MNDSLRGMWLRGIPTVFEAGWAGYAVVGCHLHRCVPHDTVSSPFRHVMCFGLTLFRGIVGTGIPVSLPRSTTVAMHGSMPALCRKHSMPLLCQRVAAAGGTGGQPALATRHLIARMP
jgi:hypothetical protein